MACGAFLYACRAKYSSTRENMNSSLSGSVDILATPMKIGDIRPFKTVVCYRGRRCDGRSRTPALRSDRPASLPSGASALPQPFQQTPVQPTAVAGDPLPDALRGLDLSRGR